MYYKICFINICVLLIYAVIGFFLIKGKLVKKESIPDFAKLLMYICQPALLIYSFNEANYSLDLGKALIISFIIIALIFALFLSFFCLLFRKKLKTSVPSRIYTIASCFGNVGFFGIPVLEAMLPNNSNALAIASVFLILMNEIGWTIGSLIISQDKKYLNWKVILFNPSMIALYVALPLFFTGTKFNSDFSIILTILGKMTTPLCMLILGMRLAITSFKTVFCNYKTYIFVIVKQIILPLIVFLALYFIPIDSYLKNTIFILSATPIASVVLNFSEMIGEGQEDSASLVLCGTILCIITMPVLMLLL